MCLTCGCDDEDNVRVLMVDGKKGPPPHEHPHDHDHDHGHAPGPEHEHGPDGHNQKNLSSHDHSRLHAPSTETLAISEAILAKNDHLAQHNRDWLNDRGITAINLMSSPGSGKTTLLERTINELREQRQICVIEGDQETTFDAERIERAGARAVQVNTGAGCHLDAPMVQRAIESLKPGTGSLLMIENVGNLVCPALFDVGEQAKVVIISVTEGDDKPLKYPHMFAAADLVVVNKIDLLPYVDFDLARLTSDARKLNRDLEVLAVSARTGENLGAWLSWLNEAAKPADAIRLNP
ncbi:MAG: [NiFe] hydrogenase nickel incorporation-associated protein HypB [uncultured Propionibacteriaceae bacterium]|uniref:[NiFe] hydrogenase nickel incorporation-associated protein HypB n=1 Tax=uncultured Propionibacteriaceae bacterium TaxID=257457 RepID=A0A6J4P1L4_9ACTN|nr:MAG: [NiFe] hydrogenase nickel incorporation-associated protein HypB [uncultured Propionibacteriaceae bacterium]